MSLFLGKKDCVLKGKEVLPKYSLLMSYFDILNIPKNSSTSYF